MMQLKGLTFISDRDARDPEDCIQVRIWDTGTDAVSELDRVMKVRAKAFQIWKNSIQKRRSMAMLEDVLYSPCLFSPSGGRD
jgi:hypothetical protein